MSHIFCRNWVVSVLTKQTREQPFCWGAANSLTVIYQRNLGTRRGRKQIKLVYALDWVHFCKIDQIKRFIWILVPKYNFVNGYNFGIGTITRGVFWR